MFVYKTYKYFSELLYIPKRVVCIYILLKLSRILHIEHGYRQPIRTTDLHYYLRTEPAVAGALHNMSSFVSCVVRSCF